VFSGNQCGGDQMGFRRVFDGAFLRAEIHGDGQNGLFVSFDHYRPGRTCFVNMTPVQMALDMGYASLVISTAANDWFLNPDLPDLRVELQHLAAQYPVVRAIGFSMGGYGALLLSNTLQLAFATLWAPQVSIRQRLAPFENRFKTEASRIDVVADQLRLHILPQLQGLVLCDPFAHPAERQHAHAIQALAPDLGLAALPFSGHPPTGVVMAGGAYQSLLRAAISGEMTPQMVRKVHASHRWGSESYLRALQARLNQREARGFAMTGT
jgi:hypothetical protein